LTRLETLNLGRNKLSALSVALALLTRLKELQLEMNPLSSPPMEIVSRGHEMVLLYLKRFDYIPGLDFTLSLPSLNLNQLPSDLRLYSSVLTSLDISNNCLETLQDNVSVLHRLRELRATSNVLSTLPEEIGALLSLQRLYLQVNRLSKLPMSVSLLRSLQVLNVVENSLTVLGPEIGGLTALRELRASRNALTAIDSSIWKCKSLETIACDGNSLIELPQSICRLPLLASLLIAKNRIERLPNRLGDLTSLTELDVAENCLEIFPPSLGQIAKNIQVLGCKGNPLSFVPPEIGSDRPKVLLGYLKALDEGFATGSLSFVEYGFSVIPPFVFTMTALTELKMSKNRLRFIDDDIVVLSCLKLLDVSDNFLRSLPLCLHTMPRLTQLVTGSPQQNQLEDPPAPVLAQGTPVIMQYLRALDVAVNSRELIIAGLRLTEFPKACLEMESLTYVDISSNDLTEIPYEIENMRNLERLNCSSNSIVQVSSSISKLPRLVFLDLRSNRLHQLPQAIKDCEALSSLLLDRNSFSAVPSAMLMPPALKMLSLAGLASPATLMFTSFSFFPHKCSNVIGAFR
jgi:Leucine-rich repeat (LRR) protein